MTAGLRGRRNSEAATAGDEDPVPACCPYYHEAVELIGRRWSGAIVEVLLQRTSMRFSEIGQAVPQISDRLLSERMKELETRGLVSREVHAGPPVRVEYSLTRMGGALGPALAELKAWAQHWLDEGPPGNRRPPNRPV